MDDDDDDDDACCCNGSVAALYGKPIESLRRDAVSVYIGCHVASTMKSRLCVI